VGRSPDAPLAEVVDDTDGRDEAARGAADELLRGRTFEDVSADLVGQGWSDYAARSDCGAGPCDDRRDRGVRTRDGVARRYARSVRLVRWLVVIVIVAVVIAVAMFVRG
jgi:hypothetical protein